ncbi:MAG: metalloregulator ArsR/SmtB family transcription factor [Pseudomonadota bacterium]
MSGEKTHYQDDVIDRTGFKGFIDIFAQMRKHKPMDENERQELADLLRALGEFNRLSLVYELCQCQQPRNAMCLCDCCSVDASVASRHLKVLAQEGVVRMEKKGRERIYSLNRLDIAQKLRDFANQIEGEPAELGSEPSTQQPIEQVQGA